MTPLKLKLCLHYVISSEDDPWIHSGAPIVGETMRDLEHDGLVVSYVNEPKYRPTRKLKAFVEMLERTPFPEPAYVDPRDGNSVGQIGN